MIPLSLKEIAEACGGRLDGADPDAIVTSVTTDSRATTAGALFFALAGEHADGHAFARDALDAGAVGVVAHDGVEIPRAILVQDPLKALGTLAEFLRGRLRATTRSSNGIV